MQVSGGGSYVSSDTVINSVIISNSHIFSMIILIGSDIYKIKMSNENEIFSGEITVWIGIFLVSLSIAVGVQYVG